MKRSRSAGRLQGSDREISDRKDRQRAAHRRSYELNIETPARMKQLPVPKASVKSTTQTRANWTQPDLSVGTSSTNTNAGDVSDDTESSSQFASALIPDLAPYNPKWPSYLMQLMNSPLNGDEWTPVMLRILSHPHEIAITGTVAGQNAFHVAVLRYPPVHVIKAMIQAAPQCVAVPNKSFEVPLHLASSSSSEEVQELLIRAAPHSVKMQDRCGDTPLHFAARQGATYSLLELMVKSAPETISIQNHRGVTPFWILPRSYLQASTFESIFSYEDGSYLQAGNDDESGEESSEVFHYASDWKLTTLFLRFSYYDPVKALRLQNLLQLQADMDLPQIPASYHWMVHAAAKAPSCPREVLRFLCSIFPEATSIVDDQGYTPLHYACMAPTMVEPEWNEHEDGFRENVPSAPIGEGVVPQIPDVVLVDFGGDADYLRNQLLSQTRSVSSQSVEEDSDDSSKCSVIDIVLESNRSVASIPDRVGRFPLAHALLSGKRWRDMKKLIAANPKALERVDYPSGNPMFMLAASAGGNLSQLNTLYHIVRLYPGALMDVTKKPFKP